ncbi:MAG: NADPH:quinone oxidoreductase family protein [Actinobacteria bacterium]|nr:NADPH:quinone oxidoreductase family protein [Actinomycetota bacterium]
MRALVCSSLDGLDGVAVGQLPAPRLAAGAARIRVRAAAVNFPDLLMVQGRYQERPAPPFAPGVEVAGEVLEVADDVEEVAVGDRVFASVPHGGYAEQVVVDTGQVFVVPDGMPLPIAATLPVAYGTAYHALVDRGGVDNCDTALILGAAGGVGLAATQIAATLGARVIAAVSSPDKADAVRAAGADEVIRYDEQDLRSRLRELAPDGVDVVFDPVGGDATEVALRSTAWGGRLLIIGFASGDIPAIPANLPLLKGCAVVGVFWGRFASIDPARNRSNLDTLAAWWRDGRIDPLVSQTFDLDHAADALRLIGDRGAIGKLVVTP